MALQGTIDAFPVADVLQLLAGSRKTGRLIVEGDRSTAQLFVLDGAVTGGSIRDVESADVTDVVVELLRYQAGSFLFEPGASASTSEPAEALDEVVAGAVDRLAAWAEIEKVVPSTAHHLVLVEAIDDDGVHLAASDWPVVVAAGRADRVADLVSVCDGPEIETCTRIAGLVERGIVRVEGPAAELVPVRTFEAAAVASSPEGTAAGGARPEPVVPIAETPIADAPIADVDVADAEIVEETSVPDDLGRTGEEAFEVVLLEDEHRPEAFPDHFPIDDLVGSADEQDPWVQLEAAGRQDRFAASQAFEHTPFDPSSVEAPGPMDNFVHEDRRFDHGAATSFGDAGPTAAFGDQAGAAPGTDALLDGPVLTASFDGSGAFTDGPAGAAAATVADSAADEVLRQMSKLSPKAAEAIAAALGSSGDPYPGAHPDDAHR